MKKTLAIIAAALAAAGCATTEPEKKAGVEVLWLGQSAFRITSPGGKVIVIDPWLVQNPTTPAQYKDLKNLGKVDVLLVTTATSTTSPTRPRSRK